MSAYNSYINKLMSNLLRREELEENPGAKRYPVPVRDDSGLFLDIPKSWEDMVDKYQPSPWVDRIGFEHDWMTLWHAPQGFPFRRIYCNTDVAGDLDLIFDGILMCGLEKELKSFDGCFNVRKIRGSKKRWSLHSFGLAVDFNASTNKMRTFGDMHPEIVSIFETHGWKWGGDFKRKDPMHFQRAWNC